MKTAGRLRRAMAIMQPGMFLSAATDGDEAVEALGGGGGLDGVGDDIAGDEGVAHTLRAHADAVGHGDGVEVDGLAPAALMPFWACSLSSPRWTLQGVMLDADEATAIWGFLKSSSVKPTARSMERAGARSLPSTITEE
jgi:hypothetical protein